MHELAIIGAGNMAEAIARGILRAKLLSESEIIASDVSEARRNLFQNELGIRAVQENAVAVREARTILLSVKPQQMATVLGDVGRHAGADALFVSIAAGVSSASIERHLGHPVPRNGSNGHDTRPFRSEQQERTTLRKDK